MAPPIPPRNRRQPSTRARLERVETRLDSAEARMARLQNTLRGVAREADVSIGCPCNRCGRSHFLVKNGEMYCPECRFRQSL
ncbi:hypothetical protein [Natrarchaeobius chitinivorans]|uniref:CopG family transcriptional regulator n=1 Tax=Natrarchaeobius chitinivorans TaxID=1679083 RepID=A0A3N6M8U0_NATCH|nr:hypothetical protein [Natrarchaeobius chitinivorans]RQG97094.1 hypothetical protein EA473_03190 [Natrarchaeobius chitinivorans]